MRVEIAQVDWPVAALSKPDRRRVGSSATGSEGRENFDTSDQQARTAFGGGWGQQPLIVLQKHGKGRSVRSAPSHRSTGRAPPKETKKKK